jgi:diguanylate cyclase (GGDEF)-like protein
MIDVDHFKQFNDGYGHAAGDVCLQQVAAAVLGVQRRPGDLAARWGGEEFVLLMPNTDGAGALSVAERLRQAVQALGLEHRGSPLGRVCVSVGVHTLQPAAAADMARLLDGADRALYLAKRSGRNRCHAFSDIARDGEIVQDTRPRQPPSQAAQPLAASGDLPLAWALG